MNNDGRPVLLLLFDRSDMSIRRLDAILAAQRTTPFFQPTELDRAAKESASECRKCSGSRAILTGIAISSGCFAIQPSDARPQWIGRWR